MTTRTVLESVQYSLRNAADAMITGACLSQEAREGHAKHIAQMLKKAGRATIAAKARLGLTSRPLFHTGTASLTLDPAGALKVALKSGKQMRVSTEKAVALLALWQYRGNVRFAEV